ncbi:protein MICRORCHIDIA 6-like isoform X1 [Tripterygium wilfordii]|nr:protein MICRORCHIDIA 6-like isoform X1 [Tripterygium wilfordii]
MTTFENMEAVKLESDFIGNMMQQSDCWKPGLNEHQKFKNQSRRQESEENRSSNVLSTGQSSSSVLEQGQSPVDDTGVCSTSSICPAPLCRQFWKAGNYDDGLVSKITLQNGKNSVHVHPMFLHSNATSHKWAFGAIAELLDNAVDEIQNGATFVLVDKTSNPRDGSPMLLIQDDGSGMDPEAIRRCMSFGFSDKKSKSAIGQYGNGFKTSSMRLGADVIVFSRRLDNRTLTQSIGLLSYTFLTRAGHDRIVVPMVDYEFNEASGMLEMSTRFGKEHFMSNLSMLLQWSPYSTELELLKQFDDIGPHGTKVIIYNLWFGDEGNMELDFDTDLEDIRLGGIIKKVETTPWSKVNQGHIANRYHYSLRVYLSILYLHIPESFSIILRGQVVEHHSIAKDLKYPECILYKPQSGGCLEGQVITTIGFLKEAPHLNIHGFNVYHKNRLILPFWKVLSSSNSRGRGVVGVLEANFVEPTHNKQDFEKTCLFQKLEGRLKEMTLEYWDCHCVLIGYQVQKRPRAPVARQDSLRCMPHSGKVKPVTLNQVFPAADGTKAGPLGLNLKRKGHDDLVQLEMVDRQAVKRPNGADCHYETQLVHNTANQLEDPKAVNLMQENRKLHAKCLEYEKKNEELNLKLTQLRSELGAVHYESEKLLAELKSLDAIKAEKVVNV